MGGEFEKLRLIPDRTPDEVIRYIYANADGGCFYRVGWLEADGDEVFLRVWFFRKYRRKKTETVKYMECIRKTSADKRTIWRNGYFGNGWSASFTPVFEQKDRKHYSYGYEYVDFDENDFNKWKEEKCDLFDCLIPILNLDELQKTRYKYCAYPQNCDLMRYLRKYAEDPSVEFFGKIGLYPFPTLLRKAKKDKQFCRFLRDNALDVDLYGPQAALVAYKQHIDVVEARRRCEAKARLERNIRDYIPEYKGTAINAAKLGEYLDGLKKRKGDQRSIYSTYNDYLKAIKGLRLDLNDTKNIYPRDFWRMHDFRVDEWEADKKKRDKDARAQLYADFRKKAETLKPFETDFEEYKIVIPSEISDLIEEGDRLHHCVGKMGYDLKVIKGTSIIAFMRSASDVKTPLYTIEYRIDLGKLAQCYGKNDSCVPDEIRQLAEMWAKDVKKRIKAEAKG